MRRPFVLVVLAALLVPPSLAVQDGAVGAASGGRIEFFDYIAEYRYSEPRTEIPIPAGVVQILLRGAQAEGIASVRPCGTAPSAADPSVPVVPSQSSQLRLMRSDATCLYSSVPVTGSVELSGSVTSQPTAQGLQFVGLPTPIPLTSGETSGSRALGRPAVVPADAKLAVVSVTNANPQIGWVGVDACGPGDPGPPGEYLQAGGAMPAVVVFVPIGPTDSLCLKDPNVLFPRSLSAELLGWLTPAGPDPTSVPPMFTLAGGPALSPGLIPMNPTRILDTRTALGCIPNCFGGSPIRTTRRQVLNLRPFTTHWSKAVSLNITVTGTSNAGYATVWPCDQPRPDTSNLNFAWRQTVANHVVVALSKDGTVCVEPTVDTALIADLTGVYDLAFGRPVQPVTPVRLLDTRNAIGVPGSSPVATDGVVTLQVTGLGGVPVGAEAVTINVTGVSASAAGFVTAWPCDHPRPNASNLNFVAGGTRPNLVTVALSASGTVCIYTSAAVHLLADVSAWYGRSGSGGFVGLLPDRILDTRNGIGAPLAKLGAEGVLTLQVAGRGGVGWDASSVMMNVTATRPETGGYVTVWPCDGARPDVSNLNFSTGETVPNLVSVKLSPSGTVCLYSTSTTDLIADVFGYGTTTMADVETVRLR